MRRSADSKVTPGSFYVQAQTSTTLAKTALSILPPVPPQTDETERNSTNSVTVLVLPSLQTWLFDNRTVPHKPPASGSNEHYIKEHYMHAIN